MIKKLRNQPYFPKSGGKLPNGSKEEEKNTFPAHFESFFGTVIVCPYSKTILEKRVQLWIYIGWL
jgi:hypothetical protein